MLLTPKPPKPPYDPEQLLVGKCGTCHSAVELKASLATAPKRGRVTGTAPGDWGDLTATECPRCKAKVYLLPKNES